ncbi:DUF1631 domain-containing protein [Lysobacter sp. GX 14042]|uniref:DUF1631 family protein n=1 Tax=Lysobacter sp. GX 14042 TaxID=2907155 RepID=UPI001F409889|nr:DUF1631 family protein [Lysobacter sp. GX 14042]MCE7031062.1 DUF1631 domain-containing protein [Lysobacter sp. GX 14042]
MRPDPTRVLEDIKRIALERLGGLPGQLYPPVEQALATAAGKAEDARTPQVLYQSQAALWVLRQHHAAHLMRYRQQVAEAFDRFRVARARDRDEAPLGLIDESQIDMHLAGQSLAEALDKRHGVILHSIDERLRVLSRVLGIEPPGNPVSPMRLAAAFVETLSDEQVPETLRGLLFRHYEHALEDVLEELYAAVDARLAQAGYGTAWRPAQVPPAPAPPPPPEGWAAPIPHPAAPGLGGQGGAGGGYHGATGGGQGGAGGHAGAAGAAGHGVAAQSGAPGPGGGVMAGGHSAGAPGGPGAATGWGGLSGDAPSSAELGELRQLLHAWREGEIERREVDARDDTGPQRQARELRLEEVFSVASLLQAEPSDMFARALAGNGSLAEVIREQLNDGSRRLGLDPGRVRLSLHEQDAIDLVAMLFDSLFRSQQLQDRARRLYGRLVLPYVKVALTDQQMFVEPEHPARRLFDAITEAVAGNRGETPQERELLDRATAVSQRVVAEYNEDVAIFETAHAELDALLRQQRRRVQLQAERAAKATYGRERLVAARARADEAVARRLAAPPLTPAVAEFLSTTWRHHLIQVALRDAGEGEAWAGAVKLGNGLVEADRIASEARGGELARHLLSIEPALTACLASSGLDSSAAEHGMAMLVKGLVYPAARRDLHPPPPAERDEDAQERSLWIAGGSDTLRFDRDEAERMRELPADTWLRVTDTRGEAVDAKIAWISPLTSRRLLVNRRGMRVLVASPEELASLVAAGRLQLGVEPTPFEQAMQHVRRQLDEAGGRA